MGITLKQFDDSIVTPKDDALLYDFMNGANGIALGCSVSFVSANQLQIAAGWGLIKGRMFAVSEQTIHATVSDSGTKRGRLIIKVDTGNITTPISFVTQMASVLPDLTQEDINSGGVIFELPLAEYDISEIEISNLISVADSISGVKPHTHDGADIDDESISGDKLKDDAIEARHIANNAISSANVVNESLTGSDLEEKTIVASRIADGNVTDEKLGSDVPRIKWGTGDTPPVGSYPAGSIYIQYE